MLFTKPSSLKTFRQYWAATIVNLGMLTGGEFFGWPSSAIPKLQQPDAPFQVNHTDITWMVSLLYVGNVISPIPTGYFMDRFGRKKSLIYGSIFPISSWVLITFARCPLHLHIARLLGGVWVGIITTIAPMYVGEVAEPKLRGALGNMFSVMTYLGTLFIYAISPYLTYRNLALSAGSVHVYFLFALLTVPESPYYYFLRKNKTKARESLLWLQGGTDNEEFELEVKAIEETILKQTGGNDSMKSIFQSHANRKAFLVVQLYAVFVKFSGMGLIMAFSSITLPNLTIKILGPNECTIILASVWVVSSLFSLILVESLGRKILLTVTSLGCGLTTFTSGLWFFLNEKTSVNVISFSWMPFAWFVFHGFFYSIGLGPIGTAIKGEYLSTDIRASASALTTVTSALASVFLNQVYLPIADHLGMFVNYWMYSVNCLVCAIFTVYMFVETKGKTLQEIQQKLAKKKTNTQHFETINTN